MDLAGSSSTNVCTASLPWGCAQSACLGAKAQHPSLCPHVPDPCPPHKSSMISSLCRRHQRSGAGVRTTPQVLRGAPSSRCWRACWLRCACSARRPRGCCLHPHGVCAAAGGAGRQGGGQRQTGAASVPLLGIALPSAAYVTHRRVPPPLPAHAPQPWCPAPCTVANGDAAQKCRTEKWRRNALALAVYALCVLVLPLSAERHQL